MNSNFKINPLLKNLGGICICLNKHDPSACMIIHIFFVKMSQLHSRSVLICLLNLTLNAKSTSHTSQFAVRQPYIILQQDQKKCNKEQRTEDRKQTDRETNYRGHSNRRWIAGLSRPIYCHHTLIHVIALWWELWSFNLVVSSVIEEEMSK